MESIINLKGNITNMCFSNLFDNNLLIVNQVPDHQIDPVWPLLPSTKVQREVQEVQKLWEINGYKNRGSSDNRNWIFFSTLYFFVKIL